MNHHHNHAAAAGPDQWFWNLPVITRTWLGATVAVTAAVNFQLVDYTSVILLENTNNHPDNSLWWQRFFSADSSQTPNWEPWRYVTCFLYMGPWEFNTLVCLTLLSNFSERYEHAPFDTGAGGRTADYCFMLLVLMTATLLTTPYLPILLDYLSAPPAWRVIPHHARLLIYSVLYIWSKRFPDAPANIWGIPMSAAYLPFVHLAWAVFSGGNYLDLVQGLVLGHVYYFLASVLPQQVHGYRLLQTPRILMDLFHPTDEQGGERLFVVVDPGVGGVAPQ